MKIILDECLPRRLIRDLHDHSVTTVPRQGWAGIKNGKLLDLVESEFDLFITIDSGIKYQQNLQARPIALIVLHAVNSRYETLQPLIPEIRKVLEHIQAGVIIDIGN